MSVRRLVILASVVAAVLAAAVPPAAAAKSYRAEHFHSRVVVEPGGSIVVTETIRFAFGPDQFTYVYRELPSRRTDGLTILDASMDGVPMDRGKRPGQFELKRDDDKRRIVWHFPATSNASRTFTVTYRAAGVVWQDTASDVLAWTLLPTRHEYRDRLRIRRGRLPSGRGARRGGRCSIRPRPRSGTKVRPSASSVARSSGMRRGR